MNLDQILILLIGTGSIFLVGYYFFARKEETAQIGGSTISISVDAGYSPSIIAVKKGQLVTLKIHRIDPSDCLDQLIIPQWNIVKALPLNKEISVTFTPDAVGEFPFHCGMNMFHGRIVVRG